MMFINSRQVSEGKISNYTSFQYTIFIVLSIASVVIVNKFHILVIPFIFSTLLLLAFIVNPVIGISILTILRGLFTFGFVEMGNLTLTIEGIINFSFLLIGLLYIIAETSFFKNSSLFKALSSFPFFIFVVYGFFGIFYASDHVEFIKKFSRLLSYYVLYLIVIDLLKNEKAVRILTYSIFIAMIVPVVLGIFQAIQNLPVADFTNLPTKGFVQSSMTKNTFGFFSAFMILFSLSFYINSESKGKKIILLGLIILFFFYSSYH